MFISLTISDQKRDLLAETEQSKCLKQLFFYTSVYFFSKSSHLSSGQT